MIKNFLQSKEWRNFQGSTGKRTFFLERGAISASIIEHRLPLVGNYSYIPRGINFPAHRENESKIFLKELIKLSEKNNSAWIRVDIDNQKELSLLRQKNNFKIVKAPHDMQPKEIFIINIDKSEGEILEKMKSKTRYNIKLAERKEVIIEEGRQYLNDFLLLTEIMAQRQNIIPHPREYYQKMLETIPKNILKLYIAKIEDKIIAADLVVFYQDTATYLHGASDNQYRNVMAPHLLKWQEIIDAKKREMKKFDFGGVKTENDKNSWQGITRFKLGFSADTKPIEFLGSYDIVLNYKRYWLYRIIQKIKSFK